MVELLFKTKISIGGGHEKPSPSLGFISKGLHFAYTSDLYHKLRER